MGKSRPSGRGREGKIPNGHPLTGFVLLWSFSRPHLSVLAGGLVLGLGTTGITLATPLIVKWTLDSLSSRGDLAMPLLTLVCLLALGLVTNLAQSMLLGRLAEQIVLEARRGLVSRFLRAKLQQIQSFPTGELVTRVTSDTVLLREATTSSFIQFINGAVSLVGTIVLMALLDWTLLATTLIAVVIVGVAFGMVAPQVGKATRRAQDSVGELGAALEGSIRAIRTVKASQAENKEFERISAGAERAATHSIRSLWLSALASTVASGGMQLAIIVVLGIGAGRVASGELEVSTLVAFLLYAFNIMDPITLLSGAFTSMQSGLAAVSRIEEANLLELEGDLDPHRFEALPDVSEPLLSLRRVSVQYEGTEEAALRDVSMDVPATGHIAIVGPSGAGKTTIFSLLLRLIDPTSGQLEFQGVPFNALSIDDIRSQIGYVEQDAPLLPGSVRENVLYDAPANASEALAWGALSAVKLSERIRMLSAGLDAPITSTLLSGGERQRLAIARALAGQPRMLLMDEATSHLDGVTEAAIQQAISETSQSRVVITIAHRLSTVLDADQIILLDEGRTRDAGTHQELYKRDKLYQEFIAALRIESPNENQ